MSTHLIFVYGSLLSGHYNNKKFLQKVKPICKTEIKANSYVMFSLGKYPGVCRIFQQDQKGYGTIKGEIYQINHETLKLLDELEGHPDWYKRTKEKTKSGHIVEFYVQPNTTSDFYIENGDWDTYCIQNNLK
ncbi:gamma-glutamylaminecyclotransferase [Anaeramoeba flamelloides]|uniref:Gamma-glutamylcyclotransferase family protein n=1 Tax=Anaeramoeba flamelloides TaxID=1746091 RepID=A0AAV7ZPK3_9EUKA|nr:gamma-glutamylaminecyclotransferase [Anaeramoeba flamelloides]